MSICDNLGWLSVLIARTHYVVEVCWGGVCQSMSHTLSNK